MDQEELSTVNTISSPRIKILEGNTINMLEIRLHNFTLGQEIFSISVSRDPVSCTYLACVVYKGIGM